MLWLTPEANSPITLYEGKVEVGGGGARLSGTGTLHLRWLPSPRLRIAMKSGAVALATALAQPPDRMDVRLTRLDLQEAAVLTEWTVHRLATPNPHLEIEGVLSATATRVRRTRGQRAVFHVTNLHTTLGRPISSDLSVTRQGTRRIEMISSEWRLLLDTVPQVFNLVKALQKEGGFAITHVAELSRTGERTFSASKSEEILEAIHYLLGLYRGGWCGPLGVHTFDKSGSLTWYDWRVPNLDPWVSRPNWSDPHHHESLAHLFDKFCKAWTDRTHRDALKLAISLYIEAHKHPSGEGSLILSQAGLELMAWVTLVEQHQLFGRKAFDSLSAPERIEELLKWAGIPLGIPQLTWNLRRFSKRHGWTSGPRALTGLRNGVVHPRTRRRTFSSTRLQRWDAMQLGLWYLELVILRSLDFVGEYGNRLRRGRYIGTVEPVPWA